MVRMPPLLKIIFGILFFCIGAGLLTYGSLIVKTGWKEYFQIEPKEKEPTETISNLKEIKNLLQKAINPENPSKEQIKSELEIQLDEAFKDKRNQALEEYTLGESAYNNSIMNLAIEHFNKCIDIVETPSAYLALANSYYSIGKYDRAQNGYHQCIQLSEKYKQKTLKIDAYGGLGNIYGIRSDYQKSLESYNRALNIAKHLGFKSGIANSLGSSHRGRCLLYTLMLLLA